MRRPVRLLRPGADEKRRTSNWASEIADFGEEPLGEPPSGFDIKGNRDSMKFHTPESQWYEQTKAEVWFNSVEAAEAAGFVNVLGGVDDAKA